MPRLVMVKVKEPFDPADIRLLRSRGVVLRPTWTRNLENGSCRSPKQLAA